MPGFSRQAGMVQCMSKLTQSEVDEIVALYQGGMSTVEIAPMFSRSYEGIRSILLRRRVIMRPPGRRGDRHHNWRGGTYLENGYRVIMVDPSDPIIGPMATKGRGDYALEHRVVMARSLGRPLRPGETVHHVNGDRLDNRLENLQLRQGNHGRGAAYCCGDCGSFNVMPQEV